MVSVNIEVLGLSGHLCSLSASEDWTLKQVAESIALLTGIPVLEQVLLFGTQELSNEVLTVESLLGQFDAPSPRSRPFGSSLVFTLVRQAEPVRVQELFRAMDRGDSAAAQRLLQQRIPNLNELHPSSGFSALHRAALLGLEAVGLSLVQRKDFHALNAKGAPGTPGDGATALHFAAAQGLQALCTAIVDHPEFSELSAFFKSSYSHQVRGGHIFGQLERGDTAANAAARQGFVEIARRLAQATRVSKAEIP